MEAVEKQIKKKPKELEELVSLPSKFNHIWTWFLELNQTRPSGFGISNITYSEMKAFFELLEIKPEPWEVNFIKMFDNIAIRITREQQEKSEKRKQNSKQK